MIDLDLLRENPAAIEASQAARGADVALVKEARHAHLVARDAQTALETLQAQHNSITKQIPKATPAERMQLIQDAKKVAAQVANAESGRRVTRARANYLVRLLPNVIIDGVPAGGEENFNTLHEVGQIPTFDFTPRDHVDLGVDLGALDLERGAKVSGSRFYFLQGIGYELQDAIFRLARATARREGFVPMLTPTLVLPEIMDGTGFLGEHADEVYHLDKDDDLYLTGTSEVALAGYHKDEILDLAGGAKRYLGISTCYRREAGAHGKDTRGILRVHQFEKLEMFAYIQPEQAEAEHARLLAIQESVLQALELPYRVIDVAAGDLGTSAARKYDIEAWVPTQGTYRELTSTSNCTTYQARRLGIRYRTERGTATAATINGTLATTRWLVAFLENHQQADGNVRVPEALQPYLDGRTTLRD